jgi:hypothetical protein
MIYIGNIEILTAKSAIYLGNVGQDLYWTAVDSRHYAPEIDTHEKRRCVRLEPKRHDAAPLPQGED